MLNNIWKILIVVLLFGLAANIYITYELYRSNQLLVPAVAIHRLYILEMEKSLNYVPEPVEMAGESG